jgi:hypothetical protein
MLRKTATLCNSAPYCCSQETDMQLQNLIEAASIWAAAACRYGSSYLHKTIAYLHKTIAHWSLTQQYSCLLLVMCWCPRSWIQQYERGKPTLCCNSNVHVLCCSVRKRFDSFTSKILLLTHQQGLPKRRVAILRLHCSSLWRVRVCLFTPVLLTCCHKQPGSRDYGELPTAIDGRSSARSALKKSCYFRIDFKISEDATVFEAVQRFAAYNIGALAVRCNTLTMPLQHAVRLWVQLWHVMGSDLLHLTWCAL